jgi:glutaredoxin
VNRQAKREDRPGASPREVTLYTRAGCHLCEEAKAAIAPLLTEFHATLREIDVDDDSAVEEIYGSDVPVIFIGEREAARHRVDVKQFRRQLHKEFS